MGWKWTDKSGLFLWLLFIYPHSHGNHCLDNHHFKISQGHVILRKGGRGSFSILGVNHMLVRQDDARGREKQRKWWETKMENRTQWKTKWARVMEKEKYTWRVWQRPALICTQLHTHMHQALLVYLSARISEQINGKIAPGPLSAGGSSWAALRGGVSSWVTHCQWRDHWQWVTKDAGDYCKS